MNRRQLQRRLDHQGGQCFYCACLLSTSDGAVAAAMRRGDVMRAATRDHFVPLSAGGADDADNIVVACAPCNEAKRSRMPTLAELVRFVELRCVAPAHRTARSGPLTASLSHQARQLDARFAIVLLRRRRRRQREVPHAAE